LGRGPDGNVDAHSREDAVPPVHGRLHLLRRTKVKIGVRSVLHDEPASAEHSGRSRLGGTSGRVPNDLQLDRRSLALLAGARIRSRATKVGLVVGEIIVPDVAECGMMCKHT